MVLVLNKMQNSFLFGLTNETDVLYLYRFCSALLFDYAESFTMGMIAIVTFVSAIAASLVEVMSYIKKLD